MLSEIQWMKYPLVLWGAGSGGAWLGLAPETIQTITPWVCGLMLLCAAGALYEVVKEVHSHPRAPVLKSELFKVKIAVGVTALGGLGVVLLWTPWLGNTPSLQHSATAWALCSAGFVLSWLVSRLVLGLIAESEQS